MFAFATRDNMSSSRQNSTSNRRRYARSSTTSVTQLLSDSCTNLLQRLTTRVRGPSNTNDRSVIKRSPIGMSRDLGSTRHRLEDKYSSILDRYIKKRDDESMNNNYKRRHDLNSRHHDGISPFVREEKTLEPSVTRTIVKSATTNSVLLSEKAYPYVSASVRREKTPGYQRIDRQTLMNSETYRRYGRHKSGNAETKNRKIRPNNRSGKSEQLEGCRLKRRCSKEPSASNNNDLDKMPTQKISNTIGNDPTLIEREAKRKEIQTLIMKYSAIDEAYGNVGGNIADVKPTAAEIIASKYQKNGTKGVGTNVEAKAIDTRAIVSCRCA
ncbi:hypothetical protein PV327_002160 [Microctonus hyperodae]|uniref:Uncharacterized protein n=1 Tax=Microctonus hyperodae TaxID=165561 RepID=A0AA39FF99_MICHY|nr:hypothetical protein PV327_002160 [Microctonus hyperodae]